MRILDYTFDPCWIFVYTEYILVMRIGPSDRNSLNAKKAGQARFLVRRFRVGIAQTGYLLDPLLRYALILNTSASPL